jgi:hypothetical protein
MARSRIWAKRTGPDRRSHNNGEPEPVDQGADFFEIKLREPAELSEMIKAPDAASIAAMREQEPRRLVG